MQVLGLGLRLGASMWLVRGLFMIFQYPWFALCLLLNLKLADTARLLPVRVLAVCTVQASIKVIVLAEQDETGLPQMPKAPNPTLGS